MHRLAPRLGSWMFAAVLLCSGGCSKFVFQKTAASLPGHRDWPQAGGGSDRASQRDTGPALPLQERHRLRMSSALGPQLIVSDGILYAPTLDGRLSAIDLSRFRVVVRKKLPQAYEAAIAVQDSSLIIAQRYGTKTLSLYDIRRGNLAWRIDAGDIATEPLVVDSLIIAAALYQHIDAYARADGRRCWQYRTSAQIHCSPAAAHGVLVAGTDDGRLLGLDVLTGIKKWETDTHPSNVDSSAAGPMTGGIYATPVIRRQTVYVGTLDQEFLGVDLFTGAIRWRSPLESKVIHAAAANDTLVVFGMNDGRIRALEAATGRTRWEFRASSGIGTSPTIAGERVFVGSLDHTLYCLLISDGTLLWSQALEGRIRTAPVVWDRYLITACEDNLLYIFEGAPAHGSF